MIFSFLALLPTITSLLLDMNFFFYRAQTFWPCKCRLPGGQPGGQPGRQPADIWRILLPNMNLVEDNNKSSLLDVIYVK